LRLHEHVVDQDSSQLRLEPTLLQRLREADNRSKRRAQLVRDGAEDRVAELVEPLPIGDVLCCPEHSGRPPARVENNPSAAVEPSHVPVRGSGTVITGKRPRVDECLLDGAAHSVSVVRVDRVEERFVGHRGAVRDPVQTVELGRPCNSVGVDVPRPAADVRDLLRRPGESAAWPK
jgi:hypothetical protein